MKLPELVAHRGFAGAFPENTKAAIEGAFALGARYVEIDVQLSAQGTPYLFHDESLKRVCGRTGSIADLVDAQVAELKAAERTRFGERFAGEPVAALSAFVELLRAQPEAHAFVEIKPVAVRRFGAQRSLEAVLEPLEPVKERCTLISFSYPFLRAARSAGGMRLGPILEDWSQHDSTQTAELEAEAIFCNVTKLPPQGSIAVGDADLAVYEVVDPQLAVELGRRGARFVESFEYAEMSAAFESMKSGA